MMPRLGLSARLMLILMLVLVGALAIGGGVAFVARSRDTGAGPRAPLPDQVAAIVDLLDGAGPSRRQLVLRAVNSDDLRVAIAATPPAVGALVDRVPAMEWLVSRYLEALPDRDIRTVFDPSNDLGVLARLVERMSPNSSAQIRIAVALRSGEWAILETRGSPTARVLGLPPGFWIGALGAALGLIAIYAIRREAGPIGELAESVTAFAGDAAPRPVAASGAPDVRALIAASNDMQMRIAALLKGRTVMLGAISHDLKTYVTRLRLRVETIDDDTMRDKAVRDLSDMTTLIDDALALARGRAAAERRDQIDLAALVAAEVSNRGSAAITLRPGSESAIVAGDAVALRRLVGNLLDNATRYATRAEIECEVVDDSIRLIVDDDGPGIPDADRAAVFEPFYRLESSRSRATGGSGLGLAIARETVEAHAGRIGIDRSPLGGARFWVLLPAGRTG